MDIEAVFMVCRKRLYENKKVVLAIPKELFFATQVQENKLWDEPIYVHQAEKVSSDRYWHSFYGL